MIEAGTSLSIDSFVLNAERLWVDSFSTPTIRELVTKREIKEVALS